jgi:hypothetical protein
VALEDRDLGRLIYRAVTAVDAVFADLADDITALVRNRPTDRRALMREIDRLLDRAFGLTQRAALVSRLFATIVDVAGIAVDLPFARAIERVRTVVDRRDGTWWRRIINRRPILPPDPFLDVVAALDTWDAFGNRITPEPLRRERLRRSRLLDPTRSWVPGERKGLSDRVWRTGRDVRRQIDETLREGIARGTSAEDLARQLDKFLHPKHANTSYRRNGKIYQRRNGNQPYAASAARRLARTEITRAHGMAVIESAKITPGVVGVRWRVSGQHPLTDPCDENARQHSDGMGPGEYKPNEVPRYPEHPQCMCSLLPVVISREEMVNQLIAKYGE